MALVGWQRNAALTLLIAACGARTARIAPVVWAPAAAGLDTAELAVANSRAFAVRFDQARYQLRLLAPTGGVRVPEDAPPSSLAIWNGGYFEHDLKPSGLLLDHGREVAGPSGGSALLLLGERAALVRYRETPPPSSGETALQIWPFLIEPGGSPGIRRNDGKLARRSAFALDDSGRGILIGISGEGLTLYDLMELCRKLGAIVAANLDGGPSTGFALTVPPAIREAAQTPVSNALALFPRAAN